MFNIRVALCLMAALLCHITVVHAQNEVNPPAVFPPSPNSAELGRYGDIPVGLSTGALSISIPLMEISTRHLSVPVSLSYSSSGFRVDAIASRAGFDWVLNAGGVITRNVFDQPDLTPGIVKKPVPNFAVKDDSLLNYLQFANDAGYESQPDIFYYNFNGYAGKFFIGDGGVPFSIPHNNFKIEYSGPTELKFIITTPDGVRYFFGGSGASEASKYSSSYDCGGSGSAGTDDLVSNAWYLTKIKHPLGDSITLSYDTAWTYYRNGVNQTLAYNAPTNSNATTNCQGCTVMEDKLCYIQYEADVVRVKEITSAGIGKIVINYKNGIGSTDKLISDIILYGADNQRLRKVVFDHQTVSSSLFSTLQTATDETQRPFLSKVREYGQLDTLPKEHRFFYKDLDSLPVRLSFAQDYAGFYNGKQNTYFVPKVKSLIERAWFNNRYGDRTPDANYASKGMLTRVVYPTGGESQISYEGNDAYVTEDIEQNALAVSASVSGNDSLFIDYEHITDTANFTAGNTEPITITANFSAPNGIDSDHHIIMTVELIDNTNNQTVLSTTVQQNQTRNISTAVTQGFDYTLKVDIVAYSGYTAYGTLNFHPPGVTTTHNKQMPGVRVQKTLLYDSVRNVPEVKRYLYRYLNDQSKSSGKIVSPTDLFVEWYDFILSCPIGLGQAIQQNTCQHATLYSKSQTAGNALSAELISYESVLLSLGEDFANGGMEYKHLVSSDGGGTSVMGSDIYAAPFNNTGYDNGTLLQENVFRKEGGSTVYLKKVQHFYTPDNRIYNKATGVVVRQNYSFLEQGWITSPPQNWVFEAFDVATYDIHSFWKYLEKTEVKEYSQTGTDSLVKVINHYFDNPAHALQTRTVTIDSRGDSLIAEKKYPQDLSFSGTEETARLGLISSYQIATLLEEVVSRGTAQTKTHYKFKQWPNGQFLPEAVLSNTGTNRAMESRLLYNAYDSVSNLLELSKAANILTAYIWGHNKSLPVAQAVNAKHDEIYYNGFEEGAEGSADAGAKTGRRSFSGNYTVSFSLPSNTTRSFILTYWSHDGSKWNLVKVPYTGPTYMLTGNKIDEVRIYPVGASMSSCTYDPLIGITSQTGVDDKVVYYQYDSNGRLMLVRDENRNILKRFCYNYAGQAENCNQ